MGAAAKAFSLGGKAVGFGSKVVNTVTKSAQIGDNICNVVQAGMAVKAGTDMIGQGNYLVGATLLGLGALGAKGSFGGKANRVSGEIAEDIERGATKTTRAAERVGEFTDKVAKYASDAKVNITNTFDNATATFAHAMGLGDNLAFAGGTMEVGKSFSHVDDAVGKTIAKVEGKVDGVMDEVVDLNKQEFNGRNRTYSGDLMIPEEAKRYSDYWRKNGIGSDETYKDFIKHNPLASTDDYFKLLTEQSPWPDGIKPRVVTLPEGSKFYMAVENNAHKNMIGGFGVKEKITSTEFVRNNLAVKSNWKETCNVIREFKVKPGINLEVLEGPVGPQIDLLMNKYLPGDMSITQYDLFSKIKPGVERGRFVQNVNEYWVE